MWNPWRTSKTDKRHGLSPSVFWRALLHMLSLDLIRAVYYWYEYYSQIAMDVMILGSNELDVFLCIWPMLMFNFPILNGPFKNDYFFNLNTFIHCPRFSSNRLSNSSGVLVESESLWFDRRRAEIFSIYRIRYLTFNHFLMTGSHKRTITWIG